VTSEAALDDVSVPVGVVIARATLGALHSAVTGVKLATHAHGETMSGIRAQKLIFGNIDNSLNCVISRLVVQSALDVGQVSYPGMVVLHLDRVDLGQPFQFTITNQRISGQIKLGLS
jgi:hypothetical protein